VCAVHSAGLTVCSSPMARCWHQARRGGGGDRLFNWALKRGVWGEAFLEIYLYNLSGVAPTWRFRGYHTAISLSLSLSLCFI